MISAEAPVLFAKAAEIFVTELSLRAWIHTEDNKRRTLQVRVILTSSNKPAVSLKQTSVCLFTEKRHCNGDNKIRSV